MTTQEFSNRFDIQYNNIATNAAPNIDEYEKSVYLTRAQQEIIKNYFNPKGNKYREGFEQSSKRRNDLKGLVKHQNCFKDSLSTGDYDISTNSQFFKIPSKVFVIVQEQVLSEDSRLCLENTVKDYTVNYAPGTIGPIKKNKSTFLDVVPKTHDEFNIQIKNPFKNPDENTVWRIDYGYSNYASEYKTIELISPYELKVYRIRYVEYPSPIILVDLDDEFTGENLTIDGRTNEQTCKLAKSIHIEILDRAVELAKQDYEYDSLQGRVQLNQRDE